MDLRQQLRTGLQGRVCLVGVGNTDYRDDGGGVRLAEQLQARTGREHQTDGHPVTILVVGTAPEEHLEPLAHSFDTVVFLDAVKFGGAPGSVVWLDSAEMQTRFPQVSTHRVSLGLLAKLIEAEGLARVWLLGIQPESVTAGGQLSAAVQTSVDLLGTLLSETLAALEGGDRSPFSDAENRRQAAGDQSLTEKAPASRRIAKSAAI